MELVFNVTDLIDSPVSLKTDTCLIAGDSSLNNISTSATVCLQIIPLNYASSPTIEHLDSA